MAIVRRKVVRIDEDKCDGCGLCVPSCAEGAIEIVDGKARLVAENLCDGLGDCLGECPQGAIIIEEREAEQFDERKAAERQEARPARPTRPAAGCPGSMPRKLRDNSQAAAPQAAQDAQNPSRLGHWPVQLALVPPVGDIWQDADVLIAADCVPFAMPDFHQKLLAGKSLAIACPKLDDVRPQVDKLAGIFADNNIRSVTVAHMEVPCCLGIVRAVREALDMSGRTDIPMRDVTIGIDGTVKQQTEATAGTTGSVK